MVRTPASNVMVNPAQHGLMLVREFFGTFRTEPRDLVAVSGDMVQDASGVVYFFVGLTADRQPVLVGTADECDVLRVALESARLHVEA